MIASCAFDNIKDVRHCELGVATEGNVRFLRSLLEFKPLCVDFCLESMQISGRVFVQDSSLKTEIMMSKCGAFQIFCPELFCALETLHTQYKDAVLPV